MSSDARSLLEEARSAFDDLEEVVKFNPKAPAGVKSDPVAMRKGQLAVLKHPAVKDPEHAKAVKARGGPDLPHIAHGALKAAGAYRRAAAVAKMHGLGHDAPEAPKQAPAMPAHKMASQDAHASHREAEGHAETAEASHNSDDAKIARNAFKVAHDKHRAAAQHLARMGQMSQANDHVEQARHAAQQAMHFHAKTKEWGDAEHMKAAGESIEGEEWRSVLFNEAHEDPMAQARALSHIANAHSEKRPNDHAAGEHLHAQAQKGTWLALQHIAKTSEDPEKHPDYEKMSELNRHHRKMAAFHGDKKAKVAWREYGGVAMNEQRRLMGFNPYPTLKESVTLKELDTFESDIQSWRYRQRDLMGLESHYPTLSEVYEPPSEEDNMGGGSSGGAAPDKSQGLKDVNYQALADAASRLSASAHATGQHEMHVKAAQAHAAAAKLATSPEKKMEHQALSTHHTVHATRSPETKMAQVQKKIAGESFNMGAMARMIAEGVVDEKISATTSDDPKHRGTMAKAIKKIGALPGQKRDIAALLKRRHPSEATEATDTRDIPKSVKHQAASIEKDGGPIKKRPGGAKTKAGVAYAIAWKNYCKNNPGSRHCHKGEATEDRKPGLSFVDKMKKKGKKSEDVHADTALARLAKKHGAVDKPHGTAAKSALDKLKAVHGKEHKEDRKPGVSFMDRMKKKGKKSEDAASDLALAKLAKRHGAVDKPHGTAAKSALDKLRAMHGKEHKESEEPITPSRNIGKYSGKKGGIVPGSAPGLPFRTRTQGPKKESVDYDALRDDVAEALGLAETVHYDDIDEPELRAAVDEAVAASAPTPQEEELKAAVEWAWHTKYGKKEAIGAKTVLPPSGGGGHSFKPRASKPPSRTAPEKHYGDTAYAPTMRPGA